MKRLMIAAIAAAACVFAGCIAPPQNAAVPPMDTRVTIAPDLCYDVVVTDVRCARGSSSYLTLQANLVNNCNRPLPVEWKVQWLDVDGVEIDSVVSSWNARMLQPYEICGLKGTAPKPDAADMRLYVRRLKK
ncbi:MAG: YcfL family protein [Kiritimatiellae bacterium]|nr:YcfL family protein [Kiritimatiellia bacterium]